MLKYIAKNTRSSQKYRRHNENIIGKGSSLLAKNK